MRRTGLDGRSSLALGMWAVSQTGRLMSPTERRRDGGTRTRLEIQVSRLARMPGNSETLSQNIINKDIVMCGDYVPPTTGLDTASAAPRSLRVARRSRPRRG